jgi:hypothetical protein
MPDFLTKSLLTAIAETARDIEAHVISIRPVILCALSLGVKRPGRKADHSPPSSAEVKNAWSYTSTPSIRLHGVVLSYSTGMKKQVAACHYLEHPLNQR